MKKRRRTWDEIKKDKEQLQKNWPILIYHGHENSVLMAKAIAVAEEILKHKFILCVGLFGSTARGENGNDVDLIIIDDGTVSMKALADLFQRVSPDDGFSSGGAYANACYLAFVEHMPGKDRREKLKCGFYEYLREPPMAIDLIFVHKRIQYSQQYLDSLVINGNDPFFFRNIGNDALSFYPEKRRFRKMSEFPGFVNNGLPSAEVLNRILDEMQITSEHSRESSQEKETPIAQEWGPEVVGFDSIGGQAQAKAEVMSLSAALNNPERYQQWGTKPPRGICLYGPPGTGKTLLARALATETKVPFYSVDASQLTSMWYGESEKNIDRTFATARKTGGILFFDEADSLASSRGANNVHEVTKRVVAALCRNMDGFKSSDRVVVFFATNRLEDMDSAVLRSGRIDRLIEVPLPDREGREQIFEIHMSRAERIARRQLFEKIDIESLLDKTEDYSGADLAEIVRRTLEAKVRKEEIGKSPGLVTTEDVLREINFYERVKEVKRQLGFRTQK